MRAGLVDQSFGRYSQLFLSIGLDFLSNQYSLVDVHCSRLVFNINALFRDDCLCNVVTFY